VRPIWANGVHEETSRWCLELLKTLLARQAALDDFYNQWKKQQQGTGEVSHGDFDKQLDKLRKTAQPAKHFTRNSQQMSR